MNPNTDPTPESLKDQRQLDQKSYSRTAAGEFAASIIHEINQPLEAISNLSYIVQLDADLSESSRLYMALLEEQLVQVRQIVGKTLNLFRSAPTLQVVDLVELAESALRLHERRIKSKSLRVARRLPAEAHVKAHSGELLQVISNLITNSIDALPEGGTIHVRVRKTNDHVHVTLADNGHGIPSTHLPRIFEPFFTTKQENGTGLGLGISKDIITRHGGTIRLRTSNRKPRNGTAFRFTLPRHRNAEMLQTNC